MELSFELSQPGEKPEKNAATSIYCVMEHRREKGKVTRCSAALAMSFRPVSTAVEFLMLGNYVLCT